MLSSLPTAPPDGDVLDVLRSVPSSVYLVLAALSLLIALRVLRSLRRGLLPLGMLLHAAAAMVVLAGAVGVALVLVAAAAVSAH